ncbi:hypothetical protein J2O08_08755 [Elizabethkingia anophelis]|uniref:hypothetical protein n=1 Tax=Elizabethkingia anophelis TaxID=1117645 RepID=UPI0020B21D7B|nr:hypothetical protein [Elizabethkingia anophelis]UTF94740.1 hypothetical protein J2O08_08755 [Elizabethkingia anophelis]
MKKWLLENKHIILISIFLLIICILIKDFKSNFKFLIYYIFAFLVVELLPKNKITSVIAGVIKFPGYLLILIQPFIKSFLFIWITIIFSFGLFLLIFSKQYFITGYELNVASIFYLSFITSSIFIIEFYEKTLNIIISIFNHHKGKKEETQFISEFSKSLMNKNRIRFIIYFIYFIFLIPFSIIRLTDNIQNYDMHILNASFYSFSTFLAYEKITQNLSLMRVNIKKTISQLVKNSIFYRDEEK